MKTKQFLLVIVALVITANVFATETPKMSIFPLEDTKALVTIACETPTINEISIVADNGDIMYYKRSKKPITAYKKIFDLSQLESGNYKVKIKMGSTAVNRDLAIKNGAITVSRQKNEMDPYFSYANNQVNVSYLNFDKKDIKLSLYDTQGLIYSSNVGNNFTVHRALDLSNLEKGKYDVMLASTDQEYWFSVTK